MRAGPQARAELAAVDALRPWSLAQPVVIIADRPLNTLPYALWARGYRVELSVADVAPRSARSPEGGS